MPTLAGWQPPAPLVRELDRSATQGVVVLDEGGTVMLLNDHAVRWLARLIAEPVEPVALPGRAWGDLVEGSVLPSVLADVPCPEGGDSMEVHAASGPGWTVERRPMEDRLTLLRIRSLAGDESGRLHLDAFLHGYPLGGLAYFDADLRYLAVGGRSFDELGPDPRGLVGRALDEVWPAETARALRPLYEAALDGVSQTATITLEGRTHLCWISPVPGTWGAGRQGLFFTCDVTETSTVRKRYQRAFEASPMPVMVHAEDGEVLAVNEAWCQRSGYGRRRLSTLDRWAELASPGDPGGIGRIFTRPFTSTGGDGRPVVTVRTAEGKDLRWELVAATLPREPDGRRVCVTMARDVTHSEAQRTRLERQNRELRVITAASRSLVRSASEEELLERVRGILRDVAGYEAAGVWLLDEEGAPGPPDTHRIFGPGSGAPVERQADAVRAAVEAELPHIASLEEEDRALAAYPLTADGQVPGALLVVGPRLLHDDPHERRLLTELATDLGHGILTRRTEARGAELARRLKRTERLESLGQLTSGVAHDFNNTLSIILGQTEILQATPGLPDEVEEDLEQIRRAALKSAQITGQLLSFTRERSEEEQVVDLQEALAACHSLLVFLVGEKHPLHLRTGLDGPIYVDIQGSQLEQVVINLVVNARDASPGGGPIEIGSRRVELDAERAAEVDLTAGTWACVSVRDEGRGMDRDTLRHVFDAFFTTKESGTGLGLATVQDIVQARGGAVDIVTAPGQGTTFQVYLPLSDRAPTPATAPPARAVRPSGAGPSPEPGARKAPTAEEEPGAGGSASARRILLVEDDRVVQDVFRQILQFAGHEVVAVGSGEAALQAFRDASDGFSLVITDVVLPDTTGKILAARIGELAPRIPVAYTSGYALEDLRTRHGFEDAPLFLKKPFTSRDILALVDRALEDGAA